MGVILCNSLSIKRADGREDVVADSITKDGPPKLNDGPSTLNLLKIDSRAAVVGKDGPVSTVDIRPRRMSAVELLLSIRLS